MYCYLTDKKMRSSCVTVEHEILSTLKYWLNLSSFLEQMLIIEWTVLKRLQQKQLPVGTFVTHLHLGGEVEGSCKPRHLRL